MAEAEGVSVEELAPDAESLTEALDERKREHRRRNAAASILQVSFDKFDSTLTLARPGQLQSGCCHT